MERPKLRKGQARVGMRVILMSGPTEVTRGVITNIGHDKYGESEGLSVARDDEDSGSGIDDDWFCMLHAEFDTDLLYYDAGISNDNDYITPEKSLSWKDRIL